MVDHLELLRLLQPLLPEREVDRPRTWKVDAQLAPAPARPRPHVVRHAARVRAVQELDGERPRPSRCAARRPDRSSPASAQERARLQQVGAQASCPGSVRGGSAIGRPERLHRQPGRGKAPAAPLPWATAGRSLRSRCCRTRPSPACSCRGTGGRSSTRSPWPAPAPCARAYPANLGCAVQHVAVESHPAACAGSSASPVRRCRDALAVQARFQSPAEKNCIRSNSPAFRASSCAVLSR
jgi:hypothetical protein